jgi:hypothetical protein
MKKIVKDIEEEKECKPFIEDKHVKDPPVDELKKVPEIVQSIDVSKIIHISESEKSEDDEDEPLVQFSLSDILHVDLFISCQTKWSKDKQFRMQLWLRWIVEKLVGVDVKMEDYLSDYNRDVQDRIAESLIEERMEGLRLFLKFIRKYKKNMQFSNFVHHESGTWTPQKLVDLAHDLWQYGILKGNLVFILSSVCVNLMYTFGGEVDIVRYLKWSNLKMLHKDGGEISYVFRDVDGCNGMDFEISETLYTNLMIFKNLYNLMKHENKLIVVGGPLDESRILCKLSIPSLIETMRGKYADGWRIEITKGDFKIMNFLVEDPNAKLPCLNFDPSIRPNGDFNFISGVHREPSRNFNDIGSINMCYESIDATIASIVDPKEE